MTAWHAEDRDGYRWAAVIDDGYVDLRTRHKVSDEQPEPAPPARLATFSREEARKLGAALMASGGGRP